jgi:hypothetical protein
MRYTAESPTTDRTCGWTNFVPQSAKGRRRDQKTTKFVTKIRGPDRIWNTANSDIVIQTSVCSHVKTA